MTMQQPAEVPGNVPHYATHGSGAGHCAPPSHKVALGCRIEILLALSTTTSLSIITLALQKTMN